MQPSAIARLAFLSLFLILSVSAFSQSRKDSSAHIQGWTFGGLPVVAYNADFGLQYGALANFYYYGDEGIRYPYYDHSLYLEYTNTTKGESKFKLRYDARQLIPDGRFKVDLQHKLTQYRPFFGFNGYEALYNADFLNPASSEFVSQLYYAIRQNQLTVNIRADKNLKGKQLRVQSNLQLIHTGISSPDLSRFNDGKASSDQAPDTTTLYDQYVDWGVIEQRDKSGGSYAQLAIGGVIDTRDIEPWPASGLWEEVEISYGVPLDGIARQYVSLQAIHRHYQTLIHDRLVFAHRIQFRSFLTDDVPFYVLQNLGGEDNLRGIKFSRLIGAGVAGANAELRWKVFKLVIFGQNIYGGVNLFYDTGIVTKKFDYSLAGIPTEHVDMFQNRKESLHHAAGMGVKGALNENFIISIDYGQALDQRDGDSGVYISLNWLF